jgi:branched-chain amino acid aminotransferase
VTAPPQHGLVWIDGEVCTADRAHISPFDHGFTVGDGVFETLRIVGGVAFALSRHLARLAGAAAAFGFMCPSSDQIREAVSETIRANGLESGRLRITLTSGPGPLGPIRGDAVPRLFVAVSPLHSRDDAASVRIVPWRRNEHGALTGIKSTSHAENVLALHHASAAGADEAVFANTAGNLCEGSGANVFLGVGDHLVTPPLSAGPLPGITRGLILELVDVAEADVPITALGGATEAFLTSSTRGVHPIRLVDGAPLPSCPGPLTQQARAAYDNLVSHDLDP